jgi:hypothetical protein
VNVSATETNERLGSMSDAPNPRALNEQLPNIIICKWGASHASVCKTWHTEIGLCLRFMYPLIMVCRQRGEHMCDYDYERITESSKPDNCFYIKAADFIHKMLLMNHTILVQFEHNATSSMQAVLALVSYLVKYKQLTFGEALKLLEDEHAILADIIRIHESAESPTDLSPTSISINPVNLRC